MISSIDIIFEYERRYYFRSRLRSEDLDDSDIDMDVSKDVDEYI